MIIIKAIVAIILVIMIVNFAIRAIITTIAAFKLTKEQIKETSKLPYPAWIWNLIETYLYSLVSLYAFIYIFF